MTSGPETDESPATGVPRRLSPLGVALYSLNSAPQLVVPALAGLWSMRGSGVGVSLFLLLLAGITVIIAAARWSAFRYTIERDEIRIEQGIVHRQTRAIPFDRIVDVGIEQQVVARLFGLAEVTFDSGGGAGEEARLRYVSLHEAHALRECVRGRAASAVAEGPRAPGAAESAAPLFAMGPRRLITMGCYSFSLVVFAIAIAAARRLDFLLPQAWFEPDYWWNTAWQGGSRLGGMGLWIEFLAGIAALLALAALGLLSGIIRAVTTWWDFRLERTAKGLRIRHGLLTRRDVTVPPGRVVAAAIQTGPIRARRGWQSLHLVSLGGNGESGAHIAAAPFARADEVAAIMAELSLAPPAPSLVFERAATGIALDRWLLAASLLAIAAVIAWPFLPPLSFAFGAAITLLSFRTWLRWRSRARAMAEGQLFTRMGWWKRQTLFARVDAVQAVTLASGPLQRRRGVVTLVFGLPSVTAAFKDVPRPEAEAIRAAVLRQIGPVDYAHLAALLAQPKKGAEA